MNGDALDEVGLIEYDPYGRSRAYVVYGRTSTTTIELSNLGTRGFVIDNNITTKSDFTEIGRAGDVNGDGRGDLALGGDGGTYVVFGKADSTAVATSTLGTSGYTIANADHALATDFGDVNRDGRSDLALGDAGAVVDGRARAGRVIVVRGQSASTTLDANNLGTNGYLVNGFEAYQYVGTDIDGAGDVNTDGIPDILVGAHGTSPPPASVADPLLAGEGRSGAAYLIYGKTTTDNQSLADLGDAGIVFRNDEHESSSANSFGHSVSGGWLDTRGAGGDIAVANSYSDNSGGNAGSVYVWDPVLNPSPVLACVDPASGQLDLCMSDGGPERHGPAPTPNQPADLTAPTHPPTVDTLECLPDDVVLATQPLYDVRGTFAAHPGVAVAEFLANAPLPAMNPLGFTQVSLTDTGAVYHGVVDGRTLAAMRLTLINNGWLVEDFAACSDFYTP